MRPYLIFVLMLCLAGACFADIQSIMGDWAGSFIAETGDSGALIAQIIAQGTDSCRIIVQVGEEGGKVSLYGVKQDEMVIVNGKVNVGPDLGGEYEVTGNIQNLSFTGKFSGWEASGTFKMRKLQKSSPTMGLKSPEHAMVLFDGSNLKQWKRLPKYKKGKLVLKEGPASWKIFDDGSMEVRKGNIATLKSWGDHQLHLEFCIPYMPDKYGQARGNSGVYVAGKYEVQVLDSYGLEPKDNLCGGIYKKATPMVNACFPPLQWQTYDITFYAPKFDDDGTKIKNAEITVKHNGILIHDQVALDGATPGGISEDEQVPGGLMLQDHGDPVKFRNIWVKLLD